MNMPSAESLSGLARNWTRICSRYRHTHTHGRGRTEQVCVRKPARVCVCACAHAGSCHSRGREPWFSRMGGSGDVYRRKCRGVGPREIKTCCSKLSLTAVQRNCVLCWFNFKFFNISIYNRRKRKEEKRLVSSASRRSFGTLGYRKAYVQRE